MRLGDMKEAKAMFEKALALDKRNNEARMNLEEVKGYLVTTTTCSCCALFLSCVDHTKRGARV